MWLTCGQQHICFWKKLHILRLGILPESSHSLPNSSHICISLQPLTGRSQSSPPTISLMEPILQNRSIFSIQGEAYHAYLMNVQNRTLESHIATKYLQNLLKSCHLMQLFTRCKALGPKYCIALTLIFSHLFVLSLSKTSLFIFCQLFWFWACRAEYSSSISFSSMSSNPWQNCVLNFYQGCLRNLFGFLYVLFWVVSSGITCGLDCNLTLGFKKGEYL